MKQATFFSKLGMKPESDLERVKSLEEAFARMQNVFDERQDDTILILKDRLEEDDPTGEYDDWGMFRS